MSEKASPLSLTEYAGITLIVAATITLYQVNYFNYLLFHSTVEIFSAVIFFIAAVIALISWRRIRNSYLLLIGVSFLFIPCIDLVHTLAYRGMSIFTTTANIPTSLWILARYMQATAFLAAPLLHRRSWDVRHILVVFAAATAVGMTSIIAWDIFPLTYAEGVGLTTFKVVSEYVISAMLVVSLLLLHRIRGEFQPRIYKLLAYSIVLSVLSELAFTSYVGVYDFANLTGHIFKLVVAYMLFKALVREGIEDPFNTIFNDYRVAQQKLVDQTVELRENAEKLDEMNAELSASNEELLSTQDELTRNSIQLSAYASRLEDMVEERTREVLASEEKLRQSHAVAAVGRMGATIAHDLRAPLNVISQAAEGLDKFPESRDRLIEMIRSNAGRALVMIDDIRNATRDIEVRAVKTDLAAVVRNAVADANPPPTIKTEIEIGGGLDSCLVDPHLVRRVLDNLIRNAVEAMPNGGKLTASAYRAGDCINISVADTGVGISDEVAEKLFEFFYTTKSNGTGLGLPFSKRAVEAHGGALTYASTPESGTVFTATLKEKTGQ